MYVLTLNKEGILTSFTVLLVCAIVSSSIAPAGMYIHKKAS